MVSPVVVSSLTRALVIRPESGALLTWRRALCQALGHLAVVGGSFFGGGATGGHAQSVRRFGARRCNAICALQQNC